MMKITVNCSFNSVNTDVDLFVGNPESSHHPIEHQRNWLRKERGGELPDKVIDSLAKLKEIAEKNNVSFEKLCEYAFQAAAIEEQQDTKVAKAEKSPEVS